MNLAQAPLLCSLGEEVEEGGWVKYMYVFSLLLTAVFTTLVCYYEAINFINLLYAEPVLHVMVTGQ